MTVLKTMTDSDGDTEGNCSIDLLPRVMRVGPVMS